MSFNMNLRNFRIQKKVVIDIYELEGTLTDFGFDFSNQHLVDILFPSYDGQIDIFLPLVVDVDELESLDTSNFDEKDKYLYRIYLTIGKMLQNRGVDVNDYVLIEIY